MQTNDRPERERLIAEFEKIDGYRGLQHERMADAALAALRPAEGLAEIVTRVRDESRHNEGPDYIRGFVNACNGILALAPHAIRSQGEREAEAKRSTEIAALTSSIRDVENTLPSTKTLVLTVMGTGASILLGLVAILAFAADRFDGGMSASGALAEQAVEQTQTLSRINDSIAALKQKAGGNDEPQTSPGAGKTGSVHTGAGAGGGKH